MLLHLQLYQPSQSSHTTFRNLSGSNLLNILLRTHRFQPSMPSPDQLPTPSPDPLPQQQTRRL